MNTLSEKVTARSVFGHLVVKQPDRLGYSGRFPDVPVLFHRPPSPLTGPSSTGISTESFLPTTSSRKRGGSSLNKDWGLVLWEEVLGCRGTIYHVPKILRSRVDLQ